jgi:hypothetical protein
VDSILATQPNANMIAIVIVIVIGDLNDYQFSTTLSTLKGGVPSNLIDTLVSSSITAYDYDVVHINSEFPDQTSDHDPQVARITP